MNSFTISLCTQHSPTPSYPYPPSYSHTVHHVISHTKPPIISLHHTSPSYPHTQPLIICPYQPPIISLHHTPHHIPTPNPSIYPHYTNIPHTTTTLPSPQSHPHQPHHPPNPGSDVNALDCFGRTPISIAKTRLKVLHTQPGCTGIKLKTHVQQVGVCRRGSRCV